MVKVKLASKMLTVAGYFLKHNYKHHATTDNVNVYCLVLKHTLCKISVKREGTNQTSNNYSGYK